VALTATSARHRREKPPSRRVLAPDLSRTRCRGVNGRRARSSQTVMSSSGWVPPGSRLPSSREIAERCPGHADGHKEWRVPVGAPCRGRAVLRREDRISDSRSSARHGHWFGETQVRRPGYNNGYGDVLSGGR
jgi:hypothetical protein